MTGKASDPVGAPLVTRRQTLVAVVGAASLIWAAGAYRRRTALADPALVTFEPHPEPRPFAPLRFSDENETSLSLTAFRGRAVLLNVWATWCPPCREEMPALDRLQGELGGADFEVVALSIDMQGLPVVRAFFKQVGIARLRMYVDSHNEAEAAFASLGIPVTLLIDREGREIARKRGPATWDDPRVVQAIRRQLSA
jgi:thiol-disulfide isomerase/thioredoxin